MAAILLITSERASGDIVAYENSAVNAIQQKKDCNNWKWLSLSQRG